MRVFFFFVGLTFFQSIKSAHIKVRREDIDVPEPHTLKKPSTADRLKIEKPVDGKNNDQLQVVNKIKELLNNKIQESGVDTLGTTIHALDANFDLSTRAADTTTTTTTTTTTESTTTTTFFQPPPPPPPEEPQQPAANPGFFGIVTQFLNSLNPFGGFGFQPVVIG